jgi:pimeloyl-ACP methyl ester carboxylesterase
MVTVVQALVVRSPDLSEDSALAVADNVERVVAGARTADDFEARVKALPWQHARVIAQTVGPFAIDGRTPDDAAIDKTFVAAAFALRTPLRISGVVVTAFGWHVIQLLSREPLPALSRERREALAEAAIAVRARILLTEALQRRREQTPIAISHDAESLMALATGASP